MLPIQITFQDFPKSNAIEAHIRQKSEKLKKFHNHIMNCHVYLDIPQKHKNQGKLFNVRIMLSIPGKDLIASHKVNQDVYVAIRDAFNAIGRQLEEYARKQNGHVKSHSLSIHGRVSRILAEEGYGFIEGIDGNEYYFSITNVSYPQFQQLSIGDYVEYIPQTFKDGRQAHHVVREKIAA